MDDRKNSDPITEADSGSAVWALFFKKLLENIDGSVVVSDIRGLVVFTNTRFLDFFRLSKDDVNGKEWIDSIIPGPDRHKINDIFEEIKRKKALGRFDSPVSVSSGDDRYFCWIGIPLEENGKPYYMFIGREEKGPPARSVKVHPAGSRKYITAHKEVVNALFEASKVSDPETAEHAARVMTLAVALAKKIRISRGNIERLKAASVLHDLGKLAVDEKILFKKGRLNDTEFEEIKKHPRWGSEMVRLVCFLQDIIPIMANHHENYDGSGYPNGVKGDDIPLESRVLSIADIYEALTADRPYRKGYSRDEAIAIMENEKGRKLDPELTDIFLKMVMSGKIEGGGR